MMEREKLVDSVFRVAKKGELLSFLRNLAIKDGTVAAELEARFLKKMKLDYAKDIADAFDEWIEHEYYDCSMHNWDEISGNVKSILSKAVLFVNSCDYVKAADVGLLVLETLAEVYDYGEIDEFQYDEDYEIANGYGTDYDAGTVSFIKDAAQFVENALRGGMDNGSIAGSIFQELEHRFREVAKALSQNNSLEGNRDALNCYNAFSRNNLSPREYFDLQMSLLDEGGDDETALELYSFLKGHPHCGMTAEAFAQSHLSYKPVAWAYSSDLESAGNLEEAIATLKGYYGKDGPESDSDEMAAKFYAWSMLKGTPSECASMARKYFIIGSDKLRYYHDLKNLVPKEKWSGVLSGLLSSVISDHAHYSSPQWLLDIYHEEKMHEELMTLIDNQPDYYSFGRHFGDGLNRKIRLLAKYASSLTQEERKLLVGKYADELYATVSNYNSGTYQTLVDSVKSLSRVNADAKARMEGFVSYLRTEYSRRRKLIELL